MQELEAQNVALQAEVARLMVELERWRRTGGLGKAMGATVGARSSRATSRSSWRRKSGRRGDVGDLLDDDDDDDDSGLASFDFAPHPVLGRADDAGAGIAAAASSVASTSKRNADHGE
jgi:hypothetical protein